MKSLKLTFLSLVLCFLAFQQVKASDGGFDNFARHQHDLMNAAYEKRDVKTYGILLDELLAKYNSLSPQDKKTYSGYLVDGYYNFSCTYSLLNKKKPALEYLDKAIKAGFVDYSHIQEDSDLDNIRHDAAFINMVQSLRKVGDYMYIIKHAGSYNPDDNRPIPVFTYQSADNPNLVILRKTFNLDSIAGSGNEVSKV